MSYLRMYNLSTHKRIMCICAYMYTLHAPMQ